MQQKQQQKTERKKHQPINSNLWNGTLIKEAQRLVELKWKDHSRVTNSQQKINQNMKTKSAIKSNVA